MKKLHNGRALSPAPQKFIRVSLRALVIMPIVTLMAMLSTSCVTPEEVQLDDDSSEFEWHDIMETSSERPSPRQRRYQSTGSYSSLTLPRPPDNLHRLIQSMPQDSGYAMNQSLSRLPVNTPYEGGYYGTQGLTKIFIAPTSKIGDYSRLYWVMVKVLSEKYGCFMVAKQYARDTTRVFCRDKRQIVFWQSKTRNWIQFATRQYDREGFEIAVKRRRIVRVSNNPVI